MFRKNLSEDCLIGKLDVDNISKQWRTANGAKKVVAATRSSEEKPPLQSVLNRYEPSPPVDAISSSSSHYDLSYDFDEASANTAPKKAYAFYSTADTDCWTRGANESMLKRIWFRPRVMKDVSNIDMTSSVMGTPVNFPLFICPMGLAKLINPDAEKGLARGASAAGILQIVGSSDSSLLWAFH